MIIEGLLALAIQTQSVTTPNVEAFEVDITTPCYNTKDFFAFVGKHKVFMESTQTSENNSPLKDIVLASETQKTIYIIRENKALKKICVLSYFQQDKKNKTEKYNWF